MLELLSNWLISAISIYIVATYLPGIHLNNFTTAMAVALMLGVINAFIKPLIIALTLPINMVTLGLFTFVINASIILGVSKIVPGFTIDGFIPAIVAAVVLWLINILINLVSFPVKKA